MTEKRWLKWYGDIPARLEYPESTLYESVMASVNRNPEAIAWEFMGTRCTYRELGERIDRTAAMLAALGFGAGDTITVAMPTCPAGVETIYAANKLGGVASVIHPLSTPNEIHTYLCISGSRFALTLDAFYPAFREAREETPLETMILCSVADDMPPLKRLGFKLTMGRKIPPVPSDPMVAWWQTAMRQAVGDVPAASVTCDDVAVILYSGGTTGTPKGIQLTNRNLVSEGMMNAVWGGIGRGDTMLAILPIFHGFGLGVCIHAVLMSGARAIMVPRFTPEQVARLVRKTRPNFLVGVPTLFEALSRNREFCGADLSCLKGVFSGGDSLPRPTKERFEAAVRARGGNAILREGYGLTEAVSAIMATPLTEYREGSIGIPYPDMDAKIVLPGTTDAVPVGQDGEICVSGPAVMKGYLNNPEETAQVLRVHEDGKTWLHTGDIGCMDEDGFFYFKQRLKRMIKSSGMNVYPSQVEAVLRTHPAVADACVVGVPDERQVERVKAFIIPETGWEPSDELAQDLIAHCRAHLIKWSCPREVEFRTEFPKTAVGKTAYRQLVAESLPRETTGSARP